MSTMPYPKIQLKITSSVLIFHCLLKMLLCPESHSDIYSFSFFLMLFQIMARGYLSAHHSLGSTLHALLIWKHRISIQTRAFLHYFAFYTDFWVMLLCSISSWAEASLRGWMSTLGEINKADSSEPGTCCTQHNKEPALRAESTV